MTRLGRFRGSTARTFLAAAKGRANLRVETDALATRLLFEASAAPAWRSASAARTSRRLPRAR